MTRREINAYISKYLDLSGKPIEALTEFRHYNIDLINHEKDQIIEFFSKIYNFTNVMSFQDLKKSKTGEELYHLEHLYDLDEFEDLIGFLFASNILIDSMITRIGVVGELGNDTRFLIRDYEEIDERDYISYLDKNILPIHRFFVNEEVIKRQKDDKEKSVNNQNAKHQSTYTKEEIKNILGYWFHKSDLAASFINYFDVLLEEYFDDVLIFAVLMDIIQADGPTTLAFNIATHRHIDLLSEINNKYKTLSEEKLEEFEVHKEEFFNRLSKEMQEKNRHL